MKIISLPVLQDNYIHIICDELNKTAIVIDPAESQPVILFLKQQDYQLEKIFLTHHHPDHVGGVRELHLHYPNCEIYGFKNDSHRLPKLTHPVIEGTKIKTSLLDFEVWHLPGHTTGHIGFISFGNNIAFTGDVLFGMGCGRIFEGTPAQKYQTLQRFKSLDSETLIYCTHEYTLMNGRFAKQVLPTNSNISNRVVREQLRRDRGEFTVPLTLKTELETNPFLLCSSLSEFTALRELRNSFK